MGPLLFLAVIAVGGGIVLVRRFRRRKAATQQIFFDMGQTRHGAAAALSPWASRWQRRSSHAQPAADGGERRSRAPLPPGLPPTAAPHASTSTRAAMSAGV